MNDEKNDKQDLLKEYIFTALMILMDKKDLDEITFKEIAEVSGVSRATCYRKYSSKEDILIQKFNELMQAHQNRFLSRADIDAHELCYQSLTLFAEHRQLLINLKRSGHINIFTDSIFNYSHQISAFYMEKNGASMPYHCYFAASGFSAVIVQWVMGGMQESIEEISKIVRNCVTSVMCQEY